LNAANLSASGSATVTVVDNGVTTTLNVASNGTVTGAANGVSGTYSAGVVTVNFANPGDAKTATITATQTDQYGNVASGNTASVTEHITAPAAPVVTITSDSNHDGVLNTSEITAEATAGVAVGTVALNAANLSASGSATVTVVDNGVTTTLNVASNGTVTGAANGVSGTYSAGVVTVNFANPGDTHSATITATQTDQYGNVASGNTASVTEDITAPSAPAVVITTDANHDGTINATELNGATTVQSTVTLNAAGQTDLANGGTVQLTVVDAGVTQTLNLHMSGGNLVDGSGNTYAYSGGVITLTEAAPGNGNSITVTATETDKAGNVSTQSSATAAQHSALPDTPVVGFMPSGLASNYYGVNDSVLSNGSAPLTEAYLDANGTPTATFIADTLNFGLNTTSTTPTTANEIINNNLGLTGNLVKWLSTDATNLQLATSYGTTTQAVVTMKGVMSLAAGTYSMTINADDGFQVLVDGVAVATSAANHALNAGSFSFTVGATAGNLHTVQIIYWDQGGATSFQASLSTNTPINVVQPNEVTATVTLDATDQTDLANGGKVVITASDGTSLTLHENSSNQLVDASNVVYTYQNGVIYLPMTAPAVGTNLTVSATVVDQYTNTSGTGSNSYHLPSAAVTIASDTNQDGYLNKTEVAAETTAGTAVANVALNASSLASNGSATITVIDNGTTTTLTVASNGTVTGAANGVSATYSAGNVAVSFANPGDGHTATVSASETDQYGNTSTVSTASVVQDITAPTAPTTSITTDTNQDGYISVAELNASATVTATVTLAAAAQTDLTNGGTVQVVVNDAGTVQNLNLHLSGSNLVDASGTTYAYSGGVITLTETAPASGSSISVSSTVTDKAGNVSVASNTATAQVDIVDAPAVAIAFPALISTGLSVSQWVNNTTINNALYTTAGNNGDGTNPGTLINTLSHTAVTPTSTTTTTSIANASVTAGTASDTTGLIYLQSGHVYTFSGTIDDSFGLVVGGKLVGTDTYGINSGAFTGSFTASATGWYTIATYHDNQSGPGSYNLNVSDNGATAVALNSTNFDLVPSVAALTSAGIALNAEVVTSTTTNITTTNNNSSGAATVSTTVTGGYYTTEPVASITLDSNDQAILTAGGTMHVTGSDGTNLTLHWNGTSLVDAGGTAHTYSGGVVSLPLAASPTTAVVSVSATVTDTHGISSLTTTNTEIYSGTNSITEVVGGDTFNFELAANGTAGTPHVETISAFNSNVASNGGDVLNLADLLQGATSSNITNYLHFTTATNAGVTTTTVHVSETGAYSAGYSSTLDTLQIALTNVDLVHSGSTTLTDAAIIQSLLTKGKLVE